MMEHKKTEEIAVNRHKVLTPLLIACEENADGAKVTQIKRDICAQNGISDRTLRRWLQNYKQNGFEGLKPVQRNANESKPMPKDLIDEAILLRREVPSRSVAQIIEILELEGKAPVGLIKRSTLQDRLTERGYSAVQMKLYQQTSVAARRFVRLNRNDMWHSDIKFGPFISIKGEKKQIYLVSFLDDATRYVIHAEFYDSLNQSVVEDCFHKAVMKEGLPQRVYFDNGKQYRTKWMERACAMLEIKLIFAKPYSPESTGKIERFNRTIDSLFEEAKLKSLSSLEGYNHYLKIWVQECYHSKVHGGLTDKNGLNTPEKAYRSSNAPLRFMPSETIALAFMHCEQRKVDKAGCISFGGKKYEAGVLFAGKTVDVMYDPADTETLTIEHKETGACVMAKELKIGIHTGPRPKLPRSMTLAFTDTSRLLDEKEKRYDSNLVNRQRAISFNGLIGKDGGENDV